VSWGARPSGEAMMTDWPDGRRPDLLEIRDLSIRYGGSDGHLAVDSVSLTVGHGERVALVGESGSGKTTLAMSIAGFQSTTNMSVSDEVFSFQGKRLGTGSTTGSLLPVKIPGIAMVFQDAMTSLDATWTVGSQMRSVLKSQGRVSRKALNQRAAEWLRRVKLSDTDRVLRSRPYELSGGMRQRVMIALALCSEPTLLIADEPTSALDAELARATMDLLVELASERGASLLIVTHDILLCREYADRLLVMHAGRIVDQLSASTAERDATHPYTVGLLKCVPTLGSVDARELPTLSDFFTETPAVLA
jgi:peptide/nickel transport system ATP-binding protein